MTPLSLRLPVAALATVLLSWGTLVHAADAQDVGILTTEIAREQNNSLLWGAYKPNLYFGVRPRIPKSFTGGLMWAKVDNFVDVQNSKLDEWAGEWSLLGGWAHGRLDMLFGCNWLMLDWDVG